MDPTWFYYVYLAAGIGVLLLIFRARRAGGAVGMVPVACATIIVVGFLLYLNSLAK